MGRNLGQIQGCSIPPSRQNKTDSTRRPLGNPFEPGSEGEGGALLQSVDGTGNVTGCAKCRLPFAIWKRSPAAQHSRPRPWRSLSSAPAAVSAAPRGCVSNISFSQDAAVGDYAAQGRAVVPPLPVVCQ